MTRMERRGTILGISNTVRADRHPEVRVTGWLWCVITPETAAYTRQMNVTKSLRYHTSCAARVIDNNWYWAVVVACKLMNIYIHHCTD